MPGILERITRQKCIGCYAIAICTFTERMRGTCRGPFCYHQEHVASLKNLLNRRKGGC